MTTSRIRLRNLIREEIQKLYEVNNSKIEFEVSAIKLTPNDIEWLEGVVDELEGSYGIDILRSINTKNSFKRVYGHDGQDFHMLRDEFEDSLSQLDKSNKAKFSVTKSGIIWHNGKKHGKA